MINSSGKVEFDRAILVSLTKVERKGCLTFYYHMYGETMGELRVTSSEARLLLVIKGNQGNKWRLAQIEVNPNEASIENSYGNEWIVM